MLTYVYYPLLLLLLFWGAKVYKAGEWNEEVLSFDHTKAFLGFCAILIMFHHISQQTCAPWLSPIWIRHGFDPFVFVGHLCVAVFFFCSGYGMYTGSKKKEDFFRHYFTKRILPILIPAFVMWMIFYSIEKSQGMKIPAPVWVNAYQYIWYIPAILYLYGAFYLSFRRIKKEWLSFLLLLIATIVYAVLCPIFGAGTWWYNTHHLFIIGALVAKHKEAVLRFFKKGYLFWTVLFFLITAVFFWASNYYEQLIGLMHRPYNEMEHYFVELTGQSISSISVVFFLLLIGMKIRIGNRVLSFLGTFTLELYLVHPLFVQIFDHRFVFDGGKPLYYIKNPALYALAVILPAIPLAFFLHAAVRKNIGRKFRK
ncbi:MAG: acyltransferase [Lachnospiraceae bacterium]|nr:acyltransferase [Lachnospiraceae bacterium]